MLGLLASPLAHAASDAGTAKKPPGKKVGKDAGKQGKGAQAKGTPAKSAGVWSYSRDAEAFMLQYRVPGDPAPVLVATCRPGAGLFQVVAEISPAKAQTGDPVRLVLSNGKVAVEFAASVFPSVSEGKQAVEAQVRLDPKMVALFKAADQLRIAVPGTNTLLPLAGAQARVPDFEKGCLRARIISDKPSEASAN